MRERLNGLNKLIIYTEFFNFWVHHQLNSRPGSYPDVDRLPRMAKNQEKSTPSYSATASRSNNRSCIFHLQSTRLLRCDCWRLQPELFFLFKKRPTNTNLIPHRWRTWLRLQAIYLPWQISNLLKTPDIMFIQEIQDNWSPRTMAQLYSQCHCRD